MIRAEVRRLADMPAVWMTLLIAVTVPPAMTLMTSAQITRNLAGGRPGAFIDTVDLGFAEVYMLMPCAIVFGVLAVAQEFASGPTRRGRGCERFTVHLAIPRRIHVLTLGSLVMLGAAVVCGIALTLSYVVARITIGVPDWGPDALIRAMSLMATWAVFALLASTLAWISRSVVVPVVVLVVGSSLLPLSHLLSWVTPLARYLPDLAGSGVALRSLAIEPLPVHVAMLTLVLWAAAAMIVSAEVVVRRDS